MKIRLTRPLPQREYGRVIPAGVVIDAPPALSTRLLRQGTGQPVLGGEAPGSAVATPETETEAETEAETEKTNGKRHARKPSGKRVKRDA